MQMTSVQKIIDPLFAIMMRLVSNLALLLSQLKLTVIPLTGLIHYRDEGMLDPRRRCGYQDYLRTLQKP